MVHDGVLNTPIANGNNPPKTVSIVHYVVNQTNGHLVRQSNRTLKNVKQVLRTPSNPTFALKCPKTTHPNLHVGDCVVVKIKVPKTKTTPSGYDAKNGVLACSLQNRLHPMGKVWINHWKIISPSSPRVFLVTTRYPNAQFVRKA
ncbi:hypothetical protein EL26_07955 [Tumebacillus flagellatus]|uniref:Uncharacterized protein n=2 Tax=Tumebacillus flagellatus TaxID=1157490 RepID=A0A074LNU9_9BACL|nr:hypothetical protein EL26_07955 [Tumebacillus flagellatus]